MNLSLSAALNRPETESLVRPNIHREIEAAGIKGDALGKFAVFALGWFGQKSPEEAVTCLERYQRLLSEAASREPKA